MNRTLDIIRFALGVAIVVVSVQASNAQPNNDVVPSIPGWDITVGQTVVIQHDAQYPEVFQFADGRLSVGWWNRLSVLEWEYSQTGRWSADGGQTWSDGISAPRKVSTELGGGEVLSLGYEPLKRDDGKYDLPQRRSLDGWTTVVSDETGVYDIPRAVPSGSDDGQSHEGGFINNSLIRLNDGRLMATWFGNYDTDTTPGDGFPESYSFRKYRQCVVFSSDEGRTWGDPVTVASSPPVSPSQEGLSEGGMTRAANGDILMAMRSGGTLAFGDPTPLYLSRSSDEGQTWSEAQAILDRGTSPNLVTMDSGIIACTTSRPGNWLLFSKDDGYTWEGEFEFAPGSSYNSIFEVAPDELLVVYGAYMDGVYGVVGTFFTVKTIPEPATMVLLVLGGLGVLARRSRSSAM